jgi:glutaconate CoA-transferase subunit B
MIIMNHEKRRFVEKTDYITSPGYLDGPGSREKVGLPPGTGPYKVYTTRGTFDFDEKTKRMRLFALNPKVTVEDVVEVDPYRIILGRGEA